MHPLHTLRTVLASRRFPWPLRSRPARFSVRLKTFQHILERNNRVLEIMADMGDKLGGEYVFDRHYIETACAELSDEVFRLVGDLSVLTGKGHADLFAASERILHRVEDELAGRRIRPGSPLVLGIRALGRDTVEEAGNKLSHLGDMHNVLELAVPDLFALTTSAFQLFMSHNGLDRFALGARAMWEAGDEDGLDELARTMREKILAGEMPEPLREAIRHGLDGLGDRKHVGHALFAVRSSAWGEDGASSFAGQHESVLGVRARDIPEAYRRVVASAYSPEAWRYRLHRNYEESDVAMAVGCQVMVDAETAGGLYTFAQQPDGPEAMLVSALWGLGEPVAGGSLPSDTYVIERGAPHAVRSRNVARKERCLRLDADKGTRETDVTDERRDMPCLSFARLEQLGEAAMALERFFRRPQEVEWAFDRNGELHILQSRPLRVPEVPSGAPLAGDTGLHNDKLLFSGKGSVPQQGVVSGVVRVVRDDKDLADFPMGAILVAQHTSPRFSRIMRKAQGILTDVGSATGHMSTLAREYRVPTIVNTGVATSLLAAGDEITLDATRNMVFRGAIPELCHAELAQEDMFEESAEYRLLRRLLRMVAPLHLVDPHDAQFRPDFCRTYHDITRYVHEKAVEEIIGMNDARRREEGTVSRRLVTDIPLGLKIIDVGGGLDLGQEGHKTRREVRLEDVRCLPLDALLGGALEPGMWRTDPVAVDLGSFMSSVTRTFAPTGVRPAADSRNLAVVSREYMNLHLRLGYHFVIVDAYIGNKINDNYAYFRFLGGVTDFIRRSRRARCIAAILERFDFRVDVHGDLVVARIKKAALPRMREKMLVLGALVGYTRQLDVLLHEDGDIERFAEAFARGISLPQEV